jgi:signal transduction histidine kinase
MPTLVSALRHRRYLLSAWPWRSLAYVLTTAFVAAPLAAVAWPLALPWLVAVTDVREGRFPEAPVLVLMVVGAVLLTVFGPVTAMPVAALERRRLAILDDRPLPPGHRAAAADPVAWLRVRFAEAATWREVLYALFLALVVPVGYGVLGIAALLVAGLVSSPLFSAIGPAYWQLGPLEVTGVLQTVPIALLGVALLGPLVYLIGLAAAGQRAVAHALLGDGPATELREVAKSRARLVDAFEAERRRIERDLHDGAQHRLTSLTLQLGMARVDVPADSPAAEPLTRAHSQAKELMVVLRDLVHGIRPQILADLGLLPALRELAAQCPVPVTVSGPETVTRPPELVEATAYYAASEALGNVVKHAGATRAELRVDWSGDLLALQIRDDGRGGADPAGGTGLTGLADRVAAVGGRLLLAGPPGGGTLVRVELPCRS